MNGGVNERSLINPGEGVLGIGQQGAPKPVASSIYFADSDHAIQNIQIEAGKEPSSAIDKQSHSTRIAAAINRSSSGLIQEIGLAGKIAPRGDADGSIVHFRTIGAPETVLDARVEGVAAQVLSETDVILQMDMQKPQSVNQERTVLQKAVVNGIRPTIRLPNTPEKVHIVDRMESLKIHGVSLAVIHDWKLEWCEGYGDAQNQMRPLQAASISKTLTAVTIMSLIKNGASVKGIPLTLDTDVSTLIGQELWHSIDPTGICDKMNPKMTIKQLLSHTAGIKGDSKEGYPGYAREVEILPSLDDIIKGIGATTNSPPVCLDSKPGQKYAYSGGGTMILQKVIDLATGSYEQAVKSHVLDPLKLSHSFFTLPSDVQPLHGEGADGEHLAGDYVRQPELAAAGLWTTASDLAELTVEIQKCLDGTGTIFDKEHADEMLTVQIETMTPSGLGVFVEKQPNATYFYHSGSNLGFRCLMVANNKGQGAVVMTNSERGNDIIPEIIRAVAEEYQWTNRENLNLEFPQIDPAVAAANANPQTIKSTDWGNNSYQGSYQFDDNVVDIRLIDGKIKLIDLGRSFDITPLSDVVGCYQEIDRGPLHTLIFHKNTDDSVILVRYGAPHVELNKWTNYLGNHSYENYVLNLSCVNGKFYAQIGTEKLFEIWPTPDGFRDANRGPPTDIYTFTSGRSIVKQRKLVDEEK